MKYPEYIMKYLRQREDLNESDTSLDDQLNKMSPSNAFSEVLKWNGLLGGWDSQIKCWIQDIYGIDLDEECE